jgi:hypothetical protein
MKKIYPKIVEEGRVTHGGFPGHPYATLPGEPSGMFLVGELGIVVAPASEWEKDGMTGPAWDHVSVSREDRVPTWEDMCWVKDWFFEEEECVVQYHPPKKDYVNNNPRVLHLWRPVGVEIPMPPKIAV